MIFPMNYLIILFNLCGFLQLSLQTEKLAGDVSSTREILEQKERLLEDKAQQLTMCQHHLQVRERDCLLMWFYTLINIYDFECNLIFYY